MTRDEAIKIVARGALADDPLIITPQVFVDLLRHLGILKLDESKSVREKLDDAYSGFASLTPSGLLRQLDIFGLKITEK